MMSSPYVSYANEVMVVIVINNPVTCDGVLRAQGMN